MKKSIFFLSSLFLIFGLVFHSVAQQAQESEAYKTQLAVYQNGLKYNDIAVAKNALYNMMALAPTNTSLLDSLAYLYFDYQQYASSLLVSRDILARNPNNLPALEISAISYESLGVYQQALSAYESLYLKLDNPYTLYKIATLQFDLGRHTESKTSIDILLKTTEIDSLNVTINEQNNQQKQIPMKAVLLAIQGLNNIELNNKETAKQNFQDALKLAPDYTMAKENLEKL